MARSDDLNNLKSEVVNMHNDRVNLIHQTKKDVNGLKDATHAMLDDFDVRDKERTKEVNELKAATQSLLADFNTQDKERAKEVDDLKAATQRLLTDFNTLDQERAKEVEDMKAEAASLIEGFKKEREMAAAAWKDLLVTMASARGGAAPKIEAVTEEETIRKKPMPKPKIAKKEVSAPVDKEKKILAIIKDNPEGITLQEIAYIMGVAFVTITRDVKKLLEEGSIKKEGNRYLLA